HRRVDPVERALVVGDRERHAEDRGLLDRRQRHVGGGGRRWGDGFEGGGRHECGFQWMSEENLSWVSTSEPPRGCAIMTACCSASGTSSASGCSASRSSGWVASAAACSSGCRI